MRGGLATIYVITWGSALCPEIPSLVFALHRDFLDVRTVVHDFFPGDNGCSSDLAPTTSVVALPTLIDEHHAVTVLIDGTTTRLPARR